MTPLPLINHLLYSADDANSLIIMEQAVNYFCLLFIHVLIYFYNIIDKVYLLITRCIFSRYSISNHFY